MHKQLALAAALVVSPFFLAAHKAAKPDAPTPNAPAYTKDGNLIAPTNYREWIFLTSGIDMSYNASTEAEHHIFQNVFVNPESYRTFVATGTWPDKTSFILEIRDAENPVSINKRGHTQSLKISGTEIHVKDNGKWSFYDQPKGSTEAKLIPPPASCYTCHEAHAAVDTTFVQFYPTLEPIAESKKTFSPSYLKEIETPAK
jgi:hypothetical protein